MLWNDELKPSRQQTREPSAIKVARYVPRQIRDAPAEFKHRHVDDLRAKSDTLTNHNQRAGLLRCTNATNKAW